jgi:pimeloyl-ACP methyl ester carboxylesterase
MRATQALHTTTTGPQRTQDDVPVLLIHGFASTASADWPGLTDRLAAAGRTVVTVDLPGHGASPDPDGPARTSTVVAALGEIVAGLGDRVDVVGYSLGARLAWELPAGTGRVRRLVLGGLSPAEPFGAVNLAAARAWIAGGPAPADPLTALIAGLTRLPGNRTDALLTVVEGLAAEPFDPASAGPGPVPALFVIGSADPMAAGSAGLAGRFPAASVATVPGDHLGALHSAEFAATVTAFLAG